MLVEPMDTMSANPTLGPDRARARPGRSRSAVTAFITGLLMACGAATAQNATPPPAAPPTLSPEEINRRLQELEQQMRDLRAALQAQQAKQAKPQPAPAPTPAPAPEPKPAQPADEVNQRLDEQDKRVDELTDRMDKLKLGTGTFLISGFVWSGLTVPQHGNSSFDAAFKPVLLWKVADNLLAAASVEFEIGDNATEVNIEYANLNWEATDWLELRGGVILHPLSTFQQSLHPQWINKLPDNPLFASDGGLAPEKGMGVEARGGVRTGAGKVTYSVFVTNGPSLITSGDQAGQLDLTEFSDVNSNKAVGGRIGYLPIPWLELAYGVQYNNVTPSDSGLPDIYLFMHDFSVSYVAEQDWLRGRIDARAEFMIADFQEDVNLGAGPFNNDRNGGYLQLAYRPTKMDGFLKNLEGVVRYDYLNQPSAAPTPADDQRWTFGVNYWPNPKTVIKVAYEFDNVNDPSHASRSNNMLMLQAAMGF
jgi:hypothetical protein